MRTWWFGLAALGMGAMVYAMGCDDGGGSGGTTAMATSTGTGSSTTSGTGGAGGAGGALVCTPGSNEACYEGPAGTENKGMCKGGQRTCLADGSGFGACTGQTLPAPEACDTPVDDDCDGVINQPAAGCVCAPASTAPCYEGPDGTKGVGLCVPGTKTCAADGKSYGACAGQVLPAPETCATPGDDDCDGMTNEEGAGCSCVPGTSAACYSGPPATQNVGPCLGGMQLCNAQGTGFGACMGEVLPVAETCNTPVDDDCNGMTNEGGAGCVCPPNAMVSCYPGPAGTQDVGACKAGSAPCNDQGTAVGACVGAVLPVAETCNTPVDDDCDGMTNEEGAGCVCLPDSSASCYTGPAGTLGVGACKAGAKLCNAQGTGFGACSGAVVPTAAEVCGNALDDNCNGMTNEGCPPTYASVQPAFQAHCSPCHSFQSSGGTNFASSYAQTQLPSQACPGLTVGACTLTAVKGGIMPPGGVCTGNPAIDAGNAACFTAAQQAALQAWINGGQQP